MFDEGVFWRAFSGAGMLDTATIVPAAGEPFDIQVDFRIDGEIVFDGIAQTVDYSIEYQVCDAQLKRGSQLRIKGVLYRCKRDPRPGDSGFHATVEVEKVP
ncbi:head-tail joining protein [Caballeronia sp. LjRoot31]|uniref:head-tail joining protein n=1 Tax=Caballeronia sp. LjRoot31 TaxID=3342324 RepID=UPI003ECDD74A